MKHRHKLLSLALLTSSLLGASTAAFGQTNVSEEPVRGPFYSGTVRAPGKGDAIAMRGIVVTLGADKQTWACYDADLMRVSLVWGGKFLEFGNTLTRIAWPPPPQVKGTPIFGTKPGPGWAKDGSLADPRANHMGPLPKDWAHYSGLYQSGDRVVLSYTVGKTTVLESPDLETADGTPIFTRTLNIGSSKQPMSLVVCNYDGGAKTGLSGLGSRYLVVGDEKAVAVRVAGGPDDLKLVAGDGTLKLEIPAHSKTIQLKLLVSASADEAALAHLASAAGSSKAADLSSLCKGGPAHWTQTVQTKGTLGTGDQPYVVDTITEPVENPYNSRTFYGGFDFFADGRAAICTFHGDVWVVSGIDKNLEKLTWKRYATGLFQPLGLKIVKDVVYVLGRDQITRLRDLNKDGEADFYENFNNDTVVTANYHEFCLDLHTDSAGNFYFAKGAPWEPEVTSPSQGCLFKVSKDGSKLEVVATGFRAPNGMTVGPRDEITVSDNQGHWMPSSKLDWIEKGGFYGMTPSAQRPLNFTWKGTNFTANPSDPQDRAKFGFKAWGDAKVPTPVSYDKPFVWLPMNMDNSSGGQVWATTDKWGPMKDKLLFMSYGKCTLFEVMPDIVDGTRQGAMIQFPLKFNSGLMRGRVNKRDGQVYVSGLRGWQNNATRDGGFYRVRYTGQKVRMPVGYHVTSDGVQLTFSCALDAKSAVDSGNYSIERWNYLWSGAYGSADYSVTDPNAKKHDKLNVTSAKLSADGKTVTLVIEDMRPSDQIKIKYSVQSADGVEVAQEVYGTVYKLSAVKAAK